MLRIYTYMLALRVSPIIYYQLSNAMYNYFSNIICNG